MVYNCSTIAGWTIKILIRGVAINATKRTIFTLLWSLIFVLIRRTYSTLENIPIKSIGRGALVSALFYFRINYHAYCAFITLYPLACFVVEAWSTSSGTIFTNLYSFINDSSSRTWTTAATCPIIKQSRITRSSTSFLQIIYNVVSRATLTFNLLGSVIEETGWTIGWTYLTWLSSFI